MTLTFNVHLILLTDYDDLVKAPGIGVCFLDKWYTFMGGAGLSFSFIPPFSVGVGSFRKEFAPLGAKFPFKIEPIPKKAMSSREAHRKPQQEIGSVTI